MRSLGRSWRRRRRPAAVERTSNHISPLPLPHRQPASASSSPSSPPAPRSSLPFEPSSPLSLYVPPNIPFKPNTQCAFPARLKSLAQKRRCDVAEAETGQSQAPGPGHRLPGQIVECGWCARAVSVPARGRVPSWCSSSCRHRAWEARRADREQPADVRVVTRTIEVEKPTIRTVEVPVPKEPRTAEEWAALLEALATRLAQGRIYRRDLPDLAPAIRRLFGVWNRTIEQPR